MCLASEIFLQREFRGVSDLMNRAIKIAERGNMRDKRFIANHAGGPLTIENHRLLIIWAIKCFEHAIEISNLINIDQRALNAIQIAKEWEKGKATVGEARHTAFFAHDAARENSEQFNKAIIRACGHTVATAHMADHSLKAKEYILRGQKNILDKNDYEKEMIWRYDPILINGRDLMPAYHENQFARLAEKLAGSACKCVISFYDVTGRCVPTPEPCACSQLMPTI